jgi:hypothetical protein
MFEDRRAARHLGMDVHTYRLHKRAAASGLTLEQQELADVRFLLLSERQGRGASLSEWYGEWSQRRGPKQQIMEFKLGQLAETYGVSVEELLKSLE